LNISESLDLQSIVWRGALYKGSIIHAKKLRNHITNVC